MAMTGLVSVGGVGGVGGLAIGAGVGTGMEGAGSALTSWVAAGVGGW